ncbi:hypothetical protein LX64_00887 [Chitinophaga skermanii]|uniref:Molybdopterin-binding protein n=1 Tax=Chitinophaga skermanii TaxID=331697 RepID=A0A327QV40_9BACT|nr:molybdopterin-binding protein [Chitinophaga skermanii]RAJ08240.1 hypothetical protein LX64_00887 [Chitinophaga skermanii]
MKYILLVFSLVLTIQTQAQQSFTVEGDVQKVLTIQFAQLRSLPQHKIDSVRILNHKLEYKKTLHNVKGVLLKDALKELVLKTDSPKWNSEFYLIGWAEDNYKVVYSWNEIFNSPTGSQTYIILSIDDTDAMQLEEKISLITTSDFATGRRFVKQLSKVVVQQVK